VGTLSVVVALPEPAKLAVPKPAAVPQPYVSEDALNLVRKVAPGWDRQALLRRYMNGIEGKEQRRDIDRAFLGWAKKFTKGKQPA
jgi:hypothetical protein